MNNKSKHTIPISLFSKIAGKFRLLMSARKFALVLEVAIVVVAFILLYQFLAKHIPGGIFSTDVLYYMDISLNNIKDPFVLNRYMHIFLQKPFLDTAPTPLAGEQNYWSFIVASTAVLTYWNARQLFNQRSIIRGTSAVLIFLSVNLLLEYSGNVFPDFSVMFMVNVFLLIYLASINRENRSKALIIILGAVLYLAFKTKETALFPLLVLLPGIGFISNRFDPHLFKKNALMLLIGFLIGVFCFAFLSGFILKDPFWGLRFGEMKDFISTYIGGYPDTVSSQQEDLRNWYSSFLLGSITFPFVFYLLSGVTSTHEVNIPRRLVWLMPLTAIAFIIPIAKVDWGGRFFLPIIPIISILGSGLIEEDVLVRNKVLIFKTGLLVFLGLVLYAGLRIGIRSIFPPLGISVAYLITVIVNPLFFTTLLAILLLIPNSSYYRNLVVLLTMLILMISSLIFNFKTAINSPISLNNIRSKQFQEIIYPLRAFSGEIQYFPDMRLATSTTIWNSVLTKNIDELKNLFNVIFDANATRGSFIFTDDLDQLLSKAMDQDFTYILITTDEWNQTLSKPSLAADIQESYRILIEDRKWYVLLMRK